ncbi:chromatin remodelling complex Rsc7/Swp82 subunit-domain-containing protein [Polychytrium aggregatum]|uniref:chromatin remodelling complex Rsc7/Swp82 subunit-domain-containing protein n=1 Tax=Polychytrium aggregatum TaxID=110093 RepID=UPI0022FF1F1C|nr:chromatin remodelling complex Rsc7/Swp82 subunit-domain-containing protein [Polychytrium aggregatum]KAI9201996.1 chromatin remodelling complex Rsc7/Swp82 subunit-domain-containing protein [Polychytrium aggregatum]
MQVDDPSPDKPSDDERDSHPEEAEPSHVTPRRRGRPRKGKASANSPRPKSDGVSTPKTDPGSVEGNEPSDSKKSLAQQVLGQSSRKPAVVAKDAVTEDGQNEELDPRGEKKVDVDGNLKGARKYKVKTFVLPRHPSRLYMLSMDVSKALGFRDSYIFFLRNPNFVRFNADEQDRQKLSDTNMLPSQLKGREVALVTARSIFRTFGYKIVKGGRPIRDDYFVGDAEEPEDDGIYEESEDEDIRRRDIAIDRSLFSNTPPLRLDRPDRATPLFNRNTSGTLPPHTLTRAQWVSQCASSAAEFNSRLRAARQDTFFDVHTGHIHIASRVHAIVVSTQILAPSDGTSTEKHWSTLCDSLQRPTYPLTIMPGQHQDVLPIQRQALAKKPSATLPQMRSMLLPPRAYPLDTTAKTKALNVFADSGFNRSGNAESAISTESVASEVASPASTTDVKFDLCSHCHMAIAPPSSSSAKVTGAEINPTTLLTCSGCKLKLHPSCVEIDDPVIVAKVQTYDWHCSNCKMCTVCHEAGDEAQLLFCDTCDRGYHMYCLSPPLDGLPEGQWLCEQCALCISCSKRSTTNYEQYKHVLGSLSSQDSSYAASGNSGFKFYVCSYCSDCFEHFTANKYCPFCMKISAPDNEDVAMAHCGSCARWVHADCDPNLTEARYTALVEGTGPAYTCSLCDTKKVRGFAKDRATTTGVTHRILESQGRTIVAPPLSQDRVGGV